jgi:hypothetical protein
VRSLGSARAGPRRRALRAIIEIIDSNKDNDDEDINLAVVKAHNALKALAHYLDQLTREDGVATAMLLTQAVIYVKLHLKAAGIDLPAGIWSDLE